MELHPHLVLDGRASEAIAFYRDRLGATVEQVIRSADRSGLAEPGAGDAAARATTVLIASLRLGGTRITLADAQPGRDATGAGGRGFALCLTCAERAEGARLYEALAEAGERIEPFEASFFAAGTGVVADRFGVTWRIEVPESGAVRARGADEPALPEPPFDIVVCGLPELEARADLRATHVLSILDPDHPVPVAFGTWDEHAKVELRFNDIVDEREGEIAPGEAEVEAILALGRDLARTGAAGRARLLVHCHAGISRSTAAMALILAQALPEEPAETIIGMVHAIREKAWPNLRIIEIGDRRLGRGGTLVAAASALHRRQLAARPQIGEVMTRVGRGREVEAAGGAPAGNGS